jgi:hypothetical protein
MTDPTPATPPPSPVQLRIVETPDQKTVRRMEIDLHGFHPRDLDLEGLLKQVWETGADDVVLVHGHGRNRGTSRAFVNSKTGHFGLCIRATIRGNPRLKPLVKISTLDCRRWGSTSVELKKNPDPTRTEIDLATVRIVADEQAPGGAPRPAGASRWPAHKSRKYRWRRRSRRKNKKGAAQGTPQAS